MKVSVLVAIYNMERFLEPFLKSLAAQCAPDLEFVFVDDASTDGSLALTRDLVRTLKMTNVRILALPRNVGVSEARQAALDAAQGDYVIYADPDDTVDPGMYRELLAVAERTGADFVWEDHYGTDGVRQDCSVRGEPTGEKVICAILAGQMMGVTWNKLIRRDFIEKCGARFLSGRVGLCEDVAFVCSVLVANPKCVHADGCHYHYRFVPGSATHSNDPRQDRIYLQPVYDHLDRILKKPGERLCLLVFKFAVYLSAQKGAWWFVCLWARRALKLFALVFCHASRRLP